MWISPSQLKLLALILAFFGPLFVAMLIYFNPHWINLPAAKSHGELISPPQPLADFTAVAYAGQNLSPNWLRGKWTLLYWDTAVCNLSCEASLFKMRQVRLSLSKDIGRTQTLYLTGALPITPSAALARHPQLVAAYLPNDTQNPLQQQFSTLPQGDIYVVDPFGNLMMRYPNTATSKGILKDMKKLLRISRIG